MEDMVEITIADDKWLVPFSTADIIERIILDDHYAVLQETKYQPPNKDGSDIRDA